MAERKRQNVAHKKITLSHTPDLSMADHTSNILDLDDEALSKVLCGFETPSEVMKLASSVPQLRERIRHRHISSALFYRFFGHTTDPVESEEGTSRPHCRHTRQSWD